MGFTISYRNFSPALKYEKAIQDATWYVPDVKKIESAVIEMASEGASINIMTRMMAWAGIQGLPAKRLVLEILRRNC